MKHTFKLRVLLLGMLALGVITSCTDLEVEETDSLITAAGFEGVEDPDSFIQGIYNSLNGQVGDQANLFALTPLVIFSNFLNWFLST